MVLREPDYLYMGEPERFLGREMCTVKEGEKGHSTMFGLLATAYSLQVPVHPWHANRNKLIGIDEDFIHILNHCRMN